jgi:hypothetical protein
VLAAVCLCGLACEDSEEVEPGAPRVESFAAVDTMGAMVSLDADAGAVTVPPRAGFVALFDRLIAWDAQNPASKGAVTLESPVPAVTFDIDYLSGGSSKYHLLFAAGPTLQIRPSPTLPSGAAVKVTLNLAAIKAKDGSVAVASPGVSTVLAFQTEPFAATVALPEIPDGSAEASVAADFVVPVAFNNLPAADAAKHITVTATAGGASIPDLMVEVTPSMMNDTTFDVKPKGGTWPAGARVSVAVDATVTDVVGVTIAKAATATFLVQGQP